MGDASGALSKTVTIQYRNIPLTSGSICGMDNYTLNGDNYSLVLVEDDAELASLIHEYLEKNGFEVTVTGDGLEAAALIVQQQPALVILDVMLPGMSGMEICRQVRADYQGPILMLTALDEDMDQMLGLELGADDYVIKPIKPRLLLSRIRALLRRANHTSIGTAIMPDLVQTLENPVSLLQLDPVARSVTLRGQPVHLSTAEFDLLKLLFDEAGVIVPRETIVQSLRGFDYDGLDRSIDRRISRLRRKLNDDPNEPQIIKTVRGKGYLLCLPEEQP